MVEYSDAGLDGIFHALADGTRRAMLAHLSDGARTVGELARPFEMSLAAASKHVKVLEAARLIRRRVEGRIHICTIDRAPLAEAKTFIEAYGRFWEDRLDALTELVEKRRPPQ